MPALEFGDIALKAPLIESFRRIRGEGVSAVLARGAVGAFLANGGGMALTLGTQLVLARWLGAKSYGIYVYVLTWVNILLMGGMLGLDTASLRFVSAYNGKQEWGKLWGFVNFSSRTVLKLSLLVAVLFFAGFTFFGRGISPEMAAAFGLGCLILPVNCLLQLGISYLQAMRRVAQAQFLQNFPRNLLLLVGLLITIPLLKGPVDSSTTMGFSLCASVITLAILLVHLRNILPPREEANGVGEMRREWLKATLVLFVISASQALLAQADVLLIGFFVDTTQSGIYAVASRIATLTTFGITAINAALAPAIADLHARGRGAELQRLITLASRAVLLYSLPVVVFLWLAGKWLLSLFGAEFAVGYPILLILSVGQLVVSLAGSVGFLLTMTGHQREAVWAICGSALLNVAFNLALIPRYGILGAAIATMLTTGLRSLVLTWFVKKRLGISATAFRLRR